MAQSLGIEFDPEEIGFEFSTEELLAFGQDEFIERAIRDGRYYEHIHQGRIIRLPDAA